MHLARTVERCVVGGGQTEVEVSVGVHRRRLDHDHVHRLQALPVEPGQLRVAHGAEVAHSLADDLPVNAAAVPGVPGEVLPGVLRLGDLRHPHGDAAPDLDVGELVLPGRQSLVQGHRMVGAPGVVHPVAGLDRLDRLFRGGQLLLVHCLIVHFQFPPFFFFLWCSRPPRGGNTQKSMR